MSEYRHITNMYTPADPDHVQLMADAMDYKIGEPIVLPGPERKSLAQLKAVGIVGLYVPRESLTRIAMIARGYGAPGTLEAWLKSPLWVET
jgi:hypothetical protein